MSSDVIFPVKYVAETVTVRWNLLADMPIGVTISSAVVTAEVFSGVDPLPSDLIHGAASISGSNVRQQLIRGVFGVVYNLICTAVLSNGTTIRKISKQAVVSNLGGFAGDFPPLELLGDLPDGFLGVSYSHNLQIVGGVPPYTNLQLIAGAMPAWLSGNIVGDQVVYTGLPNALGTDDFTPQVDDFVGQHASRPQSITVVDDVVITGDIVDGVVGEILNYQYMIAGGTPPYTVTITVGLLPTGDNADIDNTGLVTGNYSSVGTYNWTVHVLDSMGLTADHPDTCVVRQFNWVLSGENVILLGRFMLSDGTTWLNPLQSNGIDDTVFTSILYGGGALVMYAADRGVVSFDDGGTFVACTGFTGAGTYPGIYYGGAWIIPASGSRIFRNTDAINYSTYTVPGGASWDCIIELNGIVMVFGVYTGLSANAGVSFTVVPGFTFTNITRATACATDGSVVLVLSNVNEMFTTPDGINKTPVTSPFATGDFVAVAYTNNVWVIINSLGEIAWANDPTGPWTIDPFTLTFIPYKMRALNGKFVIVGQNGGLADSDVTMNWAEHLTSYGGKSIYDVAVQTI